MICLPPRLVLGPAAAGRVRMMSVPVLQEDGWGILPHSMRAGPWEMRMLWVNADSIITPERNDIPLWNHRDLLLLLKSQICVNSAVQ